MRSILFFCLLIFFFSSKSQVPDEERALTEWTDPATMVREQEQLGQAETPSPLSINLNAADEEQLRMLPLTAFLIESLLRYRSLLGHLLDVYELQAVPGWDLASIQKVLPYVYVSDGKPPGQDIMSRIKNGQHTFSWQMAVGQSAAALTEELQGDPLKMTLRYRFHNSNSLQLGFLADKDAGEPFSLNSKYPVFDFWSAHFFIRKFGPFDAIALGDYSICLGQGLIQWQGFSPSKGADAVLIKKYAPVVSAYRSAGESNFYRGAAMTIPVKSFNVTAFFSCRRWDAHAVFDSATGNALYVTSVSYSGLHRTASERAGRSLLKRISWGGCIQREILGWRLGINMISHHHAIPVMPPNDFQNGYAWRGKALHDFSIDYGKTINNFHLFGELAFSDRFSPAWVQGFLMSVGRAADISLLYRNISSRFHSLQARAFTENISPHDERGFYSGISLRPSGRWNIQMSADLFQSAGRGYQMSAIDHGSEYRFLAKFIQRKRAEINFKMVFSKTNTAAYNSVQPIRGVVTEIKNQLCIDIHLYVAQKNELSIGYTQTISSSGATPADWGYLYYMYYIHRTANLPLTIRAAFTYFKVDSYASRVYLIENQLINSSGYQALLGTGYLMALGFRYTVSPRFTIQLESGFRISPSNYFSDGGSTPQNPAENCLKAGLRAQYSF